MTVLVGYASCHGSTRGVAERLGGRLALSGLHADVRVVGDVQDVARYEAAVLGSAIHGGKWLPEGVAFVMRWGPGLCGRPIWLFSVSTVGDEEAMFPLAVARRLRAMRGESQELQEMRRILEPIEHRNFAGAVARSDWPVSGRLFFRAVGGRYGDHRSWDAVDAWGDRIAAQVLAGPRRPDPRALTRDAPTAPANVGPRGDEAEQEASFLASPGPTRPSRSHKPS